MTPDITEHIKELVTPLAEERNLFLLDVELKIGGGTEVWVYLDGKEQGVNLDECTEISRELGFLIDAHELLRDKYRLNVSSPGLSRPLTDIRQYKKNMERTIRIRYKEHDTVSKLEGTLKEVLDSGIKITDGKDKEFEVVFEEIIEAKIIPVIN